MEGVEDYGYVALLRQLVASGVHRLLKPAAADWRDWTQDPATIASVRDRLADRIEELSAG